jgi:hypothetical protein
MLRVKFEFYSYLRSDHIHYLSIQGNAYYIIYLFPLYMLHTLIEHQYNV